MNRDQMTFLYRHQVLEDANKAVRAGVQMTLAEATVVLEVTRSKRCEQWPDGSHHYYSDVSDDDDILIQNVVIPEAVELSAIRVVREAAHSAPIERKGRVELGWIDSTAHLIAHEHTTQASLIRELLALYGVEFPEKKLPSKDNKDLRKIAKKALARAGK
jgi:hypothetical protein